MLFVTYVCLPISPSLLNRMVVLQGYLFLAGDRGNGMEAWEPSCSPCVCLFSFNPHLADGEIEAQKGARNYLRSRLNPVRLLFPYYHTFAHSLRSISLECWKTTFRKTKPKEISKFEIGHRTDRCSHKWLEQEPSHCVPRKPLDSFPHHSWPHQNISVLIGSVF